MRKKLIRIILLIITLMGININTYAKDSVYYTTPKGIELTKEEYNFLVNFYWQGYVDNMSEEQNE